MKKILLFLIIILGMCGCSSNKFSNFEHYTLKDKDLMTYTYVDSDYAIADISTDGSEMSNYGIFYKINSNDYILIDKIESTQKKENIANFYDDKLYVIASGSSTGLFEYKLQQEKTKKEQLTFNYSKGFLARSIKKVENNNIYYAAYSRDDSNSNVYITLKCSLKDYNCNISNE